MEKFSISNFYHSSDRDGKKVIRNSIMAEFSVSYATFYLWVTRDNIPKKYIERFELLFDIKI
jgi:hypothetical protein